MKNPIAFVVCRLFLGLVLGFGFCANAWAQTRETFKLSSSYGTFNDIAVNNANQIIRIGKDNSNFSLIEKLDANGNILWKQRGYGWQNGNQYLNAGIRTIKPVSNGNFLLVGANYNKVFVSLVNGQANYLTANWSYSYSTNTVFTDLSAEETPDGGFVIWSPTSLLKINSTGAIQHNFHFSYPPNSSFIISDILPLADGYLLCGKNGSSAVVGRINNAGQVLWTKRLTYKTVSPGIYPIYPYDMEMAENGFILSSGTAIHKMDMDGNLVWTNLNEVKGKLGKQFKIVKKTQARKYLVFGERDYPAFDTVYAAVDSSYAYTINEEGHILNRKEWGPEMKLKKVALLNQHRFVGLHKVDNTLIFGERELTLPACDDFVQDTIINKNYRIWDHPPFTVQSTTPSKQSIYLNQGNGYTQTLTKDCQTIQNLSLNVSASGTLPGACYGECKGKINITATGGAGNYLYRINGGEQQTTPTFTDLCQGSYHVEVEDAFGAIGYTQIMIDTLPSRRVKANALYSGPACTPSSTTCLTLFGEFGQPPYTYLWRLNNVIVSTQAALCNPTIDQTYWGVVTDAYGCADSIKLPITDSVYFEAKVDKDYSVTPAKATGYVDFTYGGAAPPYTITIYSLIGEEAPYDTVFVEEKTGLYALSCRFKLPHGGYYAKLTYATGCGSGTPPYKEAVFEIKDDPSSNNDDAPPLSPELLVTAYPGEADFCGGITYKPAMLVIESGVNPITVSAKGWSPNIQTIKVGDTLYYDNADLDNGYLEFVVEDGIGKTYEGYLEMIFQPENF